MKRITAAVAAIASVALALHAAADAGPPPERPSGKVVLSLVSPPEQVAVIDLGNGRTVKKSLTGGTLCHGPVLVIGDKIVYSGPTHGEPVAIGLGLRGKPRSVVRSGVYVPSATGGRLWIGRLRSNRWMDLRSLREVTLAGRTTLKARGVPPPQALEGAVMDGLLFERGGRLRLWDPRLGRVTHTFGGMAPIAMHDRRVAWCRGRCRTLHLEGPDGHIQVRASGLRRFNEGRGGAFSPDGRLLALRSGASRVALVDTVTRAVRLVPQARIGDYETFGWSRDGHWLYVATPGGRLLAYRPGSKRPLTLPVRLRGMVMSVAGA
jgi:hypothetical protein